MGVRHSRSAAILRGLPRRATGCRRSAGMDRKDPLARTGYTDGHIARRLSWGYLYLYRDGRAVFLEEERPTLSEIEARWGHYFR